MLNGEGPEADRRVKLLIYQAAEGSLLEAYSQLESDRAEMARRGITVAPEEILDYAGVYTGKPRPISTK
jgi:hypothetical protein